MASFIPQDGQPHGTLNLLEVVDQRTLRFTHASLQDAPLFHTVISASNSNQHLHHELIEVLQATVCETGVRHFSLLHTSTEETTQHPSSHAGTSPARTIVWLGPSQEDSDMALRCIARLFNTTTSHSLRKLWSRREGQALLNLSERAVWRSLSPQLLANSTETWLYCGVLGAPWNALLSFRQMLLDLSATGRMSHHQFAHAILGSQASGVVQATLELQERARWSQHHEFPPPTSQLAQDIGEAPGLDDLSSHLDTSIHAVETRWSMLEQNVQPVPGLESMSEADLDAEIAKYAQLLQQMDVLETDLEHLDGLTTHIRCRQYEARTPRGSPEISP